MSELWAQVPVRALENKETEQRQDEGGIRDFGYEWFDSFINYSNHGFYRSKRRDRRRPTSEVYESSAPLMPA